MGQLTLITYGSAFGEQATANPDCTLDYHAGFLLRCFREVSEAAVNKLKTKIRRAIYRPSITISSILASSNGNAEYKQRLIQALSLHTVSLPVRRYLDIIDRPFMQMSDGTILPLLKFDTTSWASSVRQRSIKGGKDTNAFGSIWEKFISKTLEDHGWKIIERGLKLRRNGKTLTDIDILAFHDGVVLVAQVKAFARSGINVYEQWLSRNAIVIGAQQAKTAIDHLNENQEFLADLLQSRGVKSISNTLQPLVLTNWHIFSGWQVEQIPVLGLGELMSILRGGHVIYRNKMEVYASASYCVGDRPSGVEFLSLLKEPVAFRVVKGSIQIKHESAGIDCMELLFPKFMLADEE